LLAFSNELLACVNAMGRDTAHDALAVTQHWRLLTQFFPANTRTK